MTSPKKKLSLIVVSGVMLFSLTDARSQSKDNVRLPAVKVTATGVASAESTLPNPSAVPEVKAVAPTDQGKSPSCPNGAVEPTRIAELIRAEAARQGADVKLAIAIAEQESAFGVDNNSSAGARGPMQLMPATAAGYGVTDICDTRQNIRGGIAFLHDLNVEFGGNIFLVLAAYNAGQDRVYKARGVPPIAETVNYVAKVSNAYFDFDNALRRGRKGTKTATPPAPMELAAASPKGSDAAMDPINKPRTATPADQWIGGSVLYVGDQ